MTTKQIYSKLDLLPNSLKSEVNDFIDFLISKTNKSGKGKSTPKFGSAKGFYEMSDENSYFTSFQTSGQRTTEVVANVVSRYRS